ncbi:guanine nucleotide-binding protein subunit beta-like protein [Chaetomidium leptoderma]|uniref:Guanine nucleotide-binding protein subunit beta-like protein n=1 Tax=Chaetomidium leptoderma TaxID=669021 RepID=A0AAN6VGN4_9PEZI|nr:guanine nucleotide-binding protein subunit beta-like protein [Chaetomidium leptoderma]
MSTTDLPPRFTTDLEDTLPLPLPNDAAAAADGHSITTTSSSRQRRWDDPPEDEPGAPPPPPPENFTTMVFVKTGRVAPEALGEIMHLTWAANDTHVIGMTPKGRNLRTISPDGPCLLATWSLATGRRLPNPQMGQGVRLSGAFALKPGGVAMADMVVACPFLDAYSGLASYDTYPNRPVPRVEAFDLGRRFRLMKLDAAMGAPLAWSLDGRVLVGVSTRDSSRVVVVGLTQRGNNGTGKVERVLMTHSDEVTQLAFLPAWGVCAGALVSAGRDGYVRVTSVESGRTLKKIEIGARAPASILRVAPDGNVVVTVWGRDVVVWYLDSGRVHNYNLNAIRSAEGWPLSVSPDCRYLACRTEDGFDVSDVLTGMFRGEFATRGDPITSVAFNSDGTRVAVGDYGGLLQIFEVVTPPTE